MERMEIQDFDHPSLAPDIAEEVEGAMIRRGLGWLRDDPDLWEAAKLFMYRPKSPRYGELEELTGENWDGWATYVFSGYGWGSNINTASRHEELHFQIHDTAGRWCWTSRERQIPLGIEETRRKVEDRLRRVSSALREGRWLDLFECGLTSGAANALPRWAYFKAGFERMARTQINYAGDCDSAVKEALEMLGDRPKPLTSEQIGFLYRHQRFSL